MNVQFVAECDDNVRVHSYDLYYDRETQFCNNHLIFFWLFGRKMCFNPLELIWSRIVP